MSYTSTDLITYAVGDGTTGTIATPPFEVDSDIVVLVRASGENTASTWVLDTDYTLSGAGTGANGTLTPITTKPSGATIVIYTDPAPTLTFDFSSLPTALQSPLKSALHQLSLQVRSLKAAQRQYIKTSIFDLVAKNNAGTAAIDADRLGKLLLWNASTGAPDVIATADFIGPAGQAGAGATPDGRTILEASPVTDASAEFLSGGTFTLDPTNARHYNVQVGDAVTLLTANMTIDLAPDSADWPDTAQVIIAKGDSSEYTVTVSGLNVDGLGTYALTDQYEGVILGYHHTDGEDGPGSAGQKWTVVARATRTRLSDIASAIAEIDIIPDGTQAIVTLDDSGAIVLSETAADGTVVIDADGLVTAVPKFPADETEFVDVDASRDLAATDAFDRIYTPTGQASRKKHTILKVEATDPNDPVALNVANNCPTIAAVLVVVTGDQVGAVTLTVGGAGSINGGAGPVTILPERMFPISVENPTLTAPIVRTGATMEDGGIETVSATGTLTYKAHNGRKVLTTGNVTVPNTPGFWCIIKAGGAHTVTHNSLTSAAMSTGDEMAVLVGPSNVIDAFLCLNANRVAFS